MGMIMSFSDAIERIRFTSPKKGVVHKAELLVMLQKREGGTGPDVALVKLASGEWTVLGSRHTPNGNWGVMGYGLSKFNKSVLDALVKAGAISAETRDEHERRVVASREAQNRKWAIRQLDEACKTLGIPVPDIAAPEAAE